MVTESPRNSGIDPREVRTRDDLARYLSTSLPGKYKALRDETDIVQTATFVKSYLLEAHEQGENSVVQNLGPLFSEVLPLGDESLLLAFDQHDDAFFVDLRHSRFQVLHSIEESSRTDQTFRRLTEGDHAGFDHVWMPGPFLREMRRGQLTGFKFRYRVEVSGTVALDEVDVDPETGEITNWMRGSSKFTMELSEDTTAERELAKLLRADVAQGRKALEQIQFRSVDADEPDDYIVNGVYSYGKVVGKGTSIGGHFLTVDSVIDTYAKVIARIEEEFAIGWVPAGSGHVLRGEPFIFWFPEGVEIVDLELFAESLFRSARPFRLFGIPHSKTKRRVDVEAIDLHSGDPVSVELTPDWMRVYLPRGSCGNIIARLYTNLQHAMSSDVRLTVGDALDPFAI